MNKLILFSICLFISVSLTAETVYKKTSPDGGVVFTDKQSTDSEEVKIRDPITYKPVQLPRANLPSKKLSPSFNYKIQINQPIEDEVIVGKQDVLVSVLIEPKLKSGYGHKIRYQLAEQTIKSGKTSETFINVSRGTHTLMISIIDKNGDVVSPVASTTFHMKRFFKKPTIAKPKAAAP